MTRPAYTPEEGEDIECLLHAAADAAELRRRFAVVARALWAWAAVLVPPVPHVSNPGGGAHHGAGGNPGGSA